MSGLAILKPGQRWKAVVLVLVVGVTILAGGALVGYASGRNKASPAAASDSQQQQQQLLGVQLPFPDSAAARQLLADPATPGWLHDVYLHQHDSTLITADHTAALLLQLQLQRAVQALPSAGGSSASVPSPSSSSPPAAVSVASVAPSSAYAQHLQLLSLYQSSHTSVDPNITSTTSSSSGGSFGSTQSAEASLQPFITAAGDVLSYLRYQQSSALLPLLRDYSRSGLRGLAGFGSSSNVAAEVLRQEVQQLLQPGVLQQWYLDAAGARLGPLGSLEGQQAPAGVAFSRQGLRQSRRLKAATGMPIDLTTALLSKMQGALPQQQQQPAPPPQAPPPPAYLATQTTARPPSAEPAVQSWTAPAAAGSTASRGSPPSAATAASSTAAGFGGGGGWGSAKPAPIPAVVPGGITASVVAEPEYLAFDFEDLGAEGDSFEEEEAGSSSSSSSAADTSPDSSTSGSRAGSRQEREASTQPRSSSRRAHSSTGSATAAAHSSSQGNGNSGTSSRNSTEETEPSSQARLQSVAAVAESKPQSAEAPAATAATPASGAVGQAPRQQAHLQSAAAAAAAVQPQAAVMAAVQMAPSNSAAGAAGGFINEAAAAAAAAAARGGAPGAALCSIQQFSPAGLQRMPGAGPCPAPHLSLYSQGGWVFRPLTIPVIFHCLTFTRVLPSSVNSAPLGIAGPDAQVLLPPSWQASVAAGNLVDEANKVFFNTGIQFKLQEVRHDPKQHAYLQQPSMQAWQSCAYNAASPVTSIACLRQVARKVQDAQNALHVFVAGSRDERAYCSSDTVGMGSSCLTVASGYSSARGPWKGATANVNWKEDAVPDNFVFLSWDTFNPATANSLRFANRGGSVFASHLAQHLGLNPTSRDEVNPEGCSIVPQQLPSLSTWCGAFRQGRQPPLQELSAASSCPGESFGLLEPSVPDSCAMAFTPVQVAGLQAAVAMYRPKLIAACAAR